MYFNKTSKTVDITPEILAQIERVSGAAVSAEDVVVFEASVANTRPISKAGSIFNGGRITEETLREMAAAVNSGEQTVPLHNMHLQAYELPIGKVFAGEVIRASDGEYELRAMFYLPKSEASLIEKINLGIIDEVSIGMQSKQMICSQCGFDYLAADDAYEFLWSQTCENGHTVGTDGTHIKMAGLNRWYELSLVSLGASSKPKIVGRTRQVMTNDVYDRIAASGIPPEAVVLFTASDLKKEKTKMDPEIKAAFDALGATLGSITETLTAALKKDETTPAPVEPVVEAAAEDNSELAALKAELEAAKAKIADLEAAAEVPEPEEVEDTPKLNTEGIPTGGVSLSAIDDAKKPVLNTARVASFKTPKR